MSSRSLAQAARFDSLIKETFGVECLDPALGRWRRLYGLRITVGSPTKTAVFTARVMAVQISFKGRGHLACRSLQKSRTVRIRTLEVEWSFGETVVMAFVNLIGTGQRNAAWDDLVREDEPPREIGPAVSLVRMLALCFDGRLIGGAVEGL